MSGLRGHEQQQSTTRGAATLWAAGAARSEGAHSRTCLAPHSPPPQLEDHSDQVAKGRQQREQINAFWRTKKSASEMEEVYSGLLRSGKSTVKRHYELTGKLADEEARNNPQFARIQALLALPPDAAPEGAPADAGAAAPATPAAAAPSGGPAPPAKR